jgi:hypothetical protein
MSAREAWEETPSWEIDALLTERERAIQEAEKR